jgi:hypothetical protein
VQCKGKLPTAPLLARADGSAWNKDASMYPVKDAVIAADLPVAATALASLTLLARPRGSAGPSGSIR